MNKEDVAGASDITGAVNVKVKCDDPKRTEKTGLATFPYGEWEAAGTYCANGEHLCGFATYVLPDQGEGGKFPKGDDLGMTGLEIQCCKVPK